MSLRLILNRSALCKNYGILKKYLDQRAFSLTVVTKLLQSHPDLMNLLKTMEIDCVADSYPQNLNKQSFTDCWNLCIPNPATMNLILDHSHLSVHSNFKTIQELRHAAAKLNINHEILLMIDMGDWREGFPITYLKNNLGYFADLKPLTLRGIAINLSCFAGVKLQQHHLQDFIDIARLIREKQSFNLLSLGNSSAIPFIELWDSKKMKLWDNIDWNLRIGEALFCGTLPGISKSILELQNIFTLQLPVVEAHHKEHILNQDELIPNSFGKLRKSTSKGYGQRVILGAGKVDFDPQYMRFPESLECLGASSDLCIFLNHGTPLEEGQIIDCIPDYHAVMNLATSPRLELEIL